MLYDDGTCAVYRGDCLDLLPGLEAESVDLVYLDPPFNTNKNWTGKVAGVAVSFEDRFPDLASYVSWMEERCGALYRVLKPTGFLYLHQSPYHGVHYLKIMLDGVFGIENWRSAVQWPTPGGGISRARFARKHDTILHYAKSDAAELRGEGHGDVWDDVGPLRSMDKERTGYPTQKPERLLERIVLSSSSPGDLVLDPFCGSGTTLAAAVKAGRRAIGMDRGEAACEISAKRASRLAPTLRLEV